MEDTTTAALASYPYRNPDSLAKWTRWSLHAQIGISVVMLVEEFLFRGVLRRLDAGDYDSEEQARQAANTADLTQALLGLSQAVLLIAGGVLILRWIHRASWNARALGAMDMRDTPGWSVGW